MTTPITESDQTPDEPPGSISTSDENLFGRQVEVVISSELIPALQKILGRADQEMIAKVYIILKYSPGYKRVENETILVPLEFLDFLQANGFTPRAPIVTIWVRGREDNIRLIAHANSKQIESLHDSLMGLRQSRESRPIHRTTH